MPTGVPGRLARTGVQRRIASLIGVESCRAPHLSLRVGLPVPDLGTCLGMTSLLERLEHVLGHSPLRTTAPPRHRAGRRSLVRPAAPVAPVAATAPVTDAGPRRPRGESPAAGHSTVPAAAESVVPTLGAAPSTGFRDCRGAWHSWEDAS